MILSLFLGIIPKGFAQCPKRTEFDVFGSQVKSDSPAFSRKVKV